MLESSVECAAMTLGGPSTIAVSTNRNALHLKVSPNLEYSTLVTTDTIDVLPGFKQVPIHYYSRNIMVWKVANDLSSTPFLVPPRCSACWLATCTNIAGLRLALTEILMFLSAFPELVPVC